MEYIDETLITEPDVTEPDIAEPEEPTGPIEPIEPVEPPKTYIYADERNLVTGMNRKDMSGNSGWMEMPENLTSKTEQELFDGLADANGIPLYKVEGEAIVPRTEDEIAADMAAIPPPPPTTNDILNALLGGDA